MLDCIFPLWPVKLYYNETVKDVKVRICDQFNCQGEMYAAMGHFYAPTLRLAASAPVNGSPREHRSINNVYILTSCAVMYIPAIIGCLLSSLCISSPLTFTQPQAFRPCYYDKYILLLLVEMENGMQTVVFGPSCNLPETDLLTKTFICGYRLVISVFTFDICLAL